MKFRILRFAEIDSTNTAAINQARAGVDEGFCIVADEQTAGRGRHGRTWVSEKDAGLYFSIVLRPKIKVHLFPLITLMTAVAVHDALEKLFPIDCDIKWVNDLLVNEKKICGILAEMIETPRGLAVIVGIGINLKSTYFSPELSETATSIAAETKHAPDVGELLRILTSFFGKYCELLYSPNGAEKLREEWSKRSSYNIGKSIRVVTQTEEFTGITRGIEENGALRVETESGKIRVVNAGDITNVREYLG